MNVIVDFRFILERSSFFFCKIKNCSFGKQCYRNVISKLRVVAVTFLKSSILFVKIFLFTNILFRFLLFFKKIWKVRIVIWTERGYIARLGWKVEVIAVLTKQSRHSSSPQLSNALDLVAWVFGKANLFKVYVYF